MAEMQPRVAQQKLGVLEGPPGLRWLLVPRAGQQGTVRLKTCPGRVVSQSTKGWTSPGQQGGEQRVCVCGLGLDPTRSWTRDLRPLGASQSLRVSGGTDLRGTDLGDAARLPGPWVETGSLPGVLRRTEGEKRVHMGEPRLLYEKVAGSEQNWEPWKACPNRCPHHRDSRPPAAVCTGGRGGRGALGTIKSSNPGAFLQFCPQSRHKSGLGSFSQAVWITPGQGVASLLILGLL